MSNDYILADDLSGALEAGAAFRASGRRVVLNLDEGVTSAGEPATLTLFSSETRNLPGAVAATFVRPLLARQRAAGARLLFKKIDSTLRGPVGGEILAVKQELAPPLIVVCPATPAVGREVRDGVLLVDGVPVAETEFRNDPGSPVAESRVAEVLRSQGVDRVTSLPLSRLRDGGSLDASESEGILVSDAANEADLARLVTLVRQLQPDAVFVGAGGLAHALAGSIASGGETNPAFQVGGGRVLIVSGSMKEGSRRQLENLRQSHLVPLQEIRLAGETGHDVLNRLANLLVEFGSASLAIAPTAHPVDPIEPVRRLAEVVRMLSVIGETPDVLAVTGGETARAVCAALEIRQLELIGELERGVVATKPIACAHAVPAQLVIKPGGFGSDAVWTRLIREKSAQ